MSTKSRRSSAQSMDSLSPNEDDHEQTEISLISSKTEHGKRLPSVFLSYVLLVLFAMTCYTTFWLPYPEMRPAAGQPRVSHPSPFLKSSLFHERQHRGKHQLTTTAVAASTAKTLHHARASTDMTLTYERPKAPSLSESRWQEDSMERYYQQEGFVDYSWTKYVNMLALGIVLLWLLWEHGLVVILSTTFHRQPSNPGQAPKEFINLV